MTKAKHTRRDAEKGQRLRGGARQVTNPYSSTDLLDLLPDMFFSLSADGVILGANLQAKKKIQGSKGSLVDRKFFDIVAPGFRANTRNALHRCLETDRAQTLEAQLIDNAGRTIDVQVFISRFPRRGSFIEDACIVLARDVTEQKRRELELLRFYNIAQNTINPVEITDVDGKIVYVNPAFEKASGYTQEELVGKNPNVFGSGKQSKSFWEIMWKTILSGKVWMGKIENRRKDGDPFYTQLLISPIVDSGGTIVGFFGVHRDISEQKFLEEHLMHAQKMESIGTLASGLAHEVGNPLTSIASLVQVLQRTTEDKFAKEKLELIRHQITRISKIIRDLVDFSRPSKYEINPTDVNKSVQEAVGIVKVGKKAKDVHFDLKLKNNLPTLPLVTDQIEQVFINILLNAVDAIGGKYPSGGPGSGEISVRTSVDKENIVITIKDNGRGISEEDIPKVFEPFFTTKTPGEGTGLGLWVSYGIVKSFQGDIQVESQIREGTKFTITLPLHTET